MDGPEQSVAAAPAIVEETPVEALAGDSVERAVEEETAAAARDYRPDSPDDFRVACRDVSMPLPEERSSEASSS